MACLHKGASTKTTKIKFMINTVCGKKDLDDKNTYFPPAIMPAIIEDFAGDTRIAEPEIRLSFWRSSLKSIISTNMSGSPQIDKIIKDLNEDLQVNFYNQNSEFLALYSQELCLKPHGKKIDVFEREDGHKKRIFYIYFNDFADDDESFKKFHRRMESFALLFIDGARRITVDPKWCCFTLYEKSKRRYNFIGYSTVYRFPLIPGKIRPRISQFFIIPPCQRNGFGKKLLRAVQNYIIENFNLLEITVEDPCDAFSEMRDIVEAERILTWNPSFIPQILNPNPVNKRQVLKEFHKLLYIPNKRTVHMYELVKLYCILKNDPVKIEELRNEVVERIKAQRMHKSKFTSSQKHSYYYLRSPKKHTKIPEEYAKLFQKYSLQVAIKLIRTEYKWLYPNLQNNANIFTRQQRQSLRPIEMFLGRPAISLDEIDEQFTDLFKKSVIIVEKLIASDSD